MDSDTLNEKRRLTTEWLKNAKSLYFFLPDGPYGRPFDSVFSLKECRLNGQWFEIYLSDGVVFKLGGEWSSQEESTKLRISGFEKLEFTDGDNGSREYAGGELCFVKF